MKKLISRLLLLGVALFLLFMTSAVSPIARADSIGQCGAPYIRRGFCLDFGIARWCITESEACADCDGGTFCYPLQ